MVGQIFDFLQTLLAQFAGGPGPPENNLVRFGLAATLWAVLLVAAWTRQRAQDLPREKLLLWGFGLGMVRELFMFVETAMRISMVSSTERGHTFHEPIEHALAMAAVIMVAGAFLRYLLHDSHLSKRYLQAGLGMTAVALVVTSWTWPLRVASHPDLRFHQSWEAWLFHVPLSLLIFVAIMIMEKERGWLRNVVTLALLFFMISEIMILINFATDRAYNTIVCPIGNSLHILAIPLLGYVYWREQFMEKRRIEADLEAYRDHLKELVAERTSELRTVNKQLNQEIQERNRAEAEIAQRNARLATQNKMAATLSQSLELPTILDAALDSLLSFLNMEEGLIFLLDKDEESLILQSYRIQLPDAEPVQPIQRHCVCAHLAREAMLEKEAVLLKVAEDGKRFPAACVMKETLRTIVSTPLVSKGRAVGAITMGTGRADAVQQSELELLTTIGQQIGIAVENASLYQDAERWAEELALLHRVSMDLTATLNPEMIYQEIVQQSTLLVDCQMATVLLWPDLRGPARMMSTFGMRDVEADTLCKHSVLSDLCRDLGEGQRPIAIVDARSDPRVPRAWVEEIELRSLLCIPIWGSKRPLEVLLLLDRRRTRQWRPQQLELIENFVNRAAVALVNANLHRQLEWTAALEERQRIAANMHDGLAQMLSLLGLKVDLVGDLLEKEAISRIAAELCSMREVVERASVEVRHSIASLQDLPPPRRSLQDQLRALLSQVHSEDGLAVNLVTSVVEPVFLPPDQQEQVVPVIQEALQNAWRHAQARRIDVVLEQEAGATSITVADDGQGFDPAAVPEQAEHHFGLSIMQARAARLGGTLRIDSAPGQGTRISLTWEENRDPSGISSGVDPVTTMHTVYAMEVTS